MGAFDDLIGLHAQGLLHTYSGTGFSASTPPTATPNSTANFFTQIVRKPPAPSESSPLVVNRWLSNPQQAEQQQQTPRQSFSLPRLGGGVGGGGGFGGDGGPIGYYPDVFSTIDYGGQAPSSGGGPIGTATSTITYPPAEKSDGGDKQEFSRSRR